MGLKKHKRALLSAYFKDDLKPLAQYLHGQGVELLSTGGTGAQLEAWGIPWIPIEEITGFPEVFGGRVKTLHPKVFGGLLQRSWHPKDMSEAAQHDLLAIDLLVVELYPFAETVRSGAFLDEIIEKIDVGGVSLLRAAGKNYQDVLVVSSRSDYAEVLTHLETHQGCSAVDFRRRMGGRAFQQTAAYDATIEQWFHTGEITFDGGGMQEWKSLRYGENPHQKGWWKGNPEAHFEQLHGKELSYNNLLDLDAGLELLSDLGENAVLVLKHNVACGASRNPVLEKAWEEALSGDPVSAFGGVILSGRQVTLAMAKAMHGVFFELLAAPSFEPEALKLLQEKKQRMLLAIPKMPAQNHWRFKSLLGGTLWQERDQGLPEHKLVTDRQASPDELGDLEFARILVKHAKSNAVVLVHGGKLIGTGSGHVSRVDAVRFAIQKAKEFGHVLEGAVMASDAFFPFSDCVLLAADAGIVAIWEPGGSIRDQESIDAAAHRGLSLVLGGIRHFRHG